MNEQDAERIRTKDRADKYGIVCACCAYAPTCPMLTDVLWHNIWEMYLRKHAEGYMHQRQLRCTCRMTETHGTADHHSAACEVTRGKPRALLCLEHAEQVLGRPLALDDLESCVANYAHFVMQRRTQPVEGTTEP